MVGSFLVCTLTVFISSFGQSIICVVYLVTRSAIDCRDFSLTCSWLFWTCHVCVFDYIQRFGDFFDRDCDTYARVLLLTPSHIPIVILEDLYHPLMSCSSCYNESPAFILYKFNLDDHCVIFENSNYFKILANVTLTQMKYWQYFNNTYILYGSFKST